MNAERFTQLVIECGKRYVEEVPDFYSPTKTFEESSEAEVMEDFGCWIANVYVDADAT